MSFSKKTTRTVLLAASVIGAMFAGVLPAIAENSAPGRPRTGSKPGLRLIQS